jgi:hypothetical protein
MTRPKMIFATFALSLLASAAAIDCALAQNQPAPAQGESGGSGHPHVFSFLTPEERMMMFVQMHEATANMTDDQKQAYRQQQRDKFMAMSDTDKQKFAADLHVKWNALPADKQAEIKSQMEAYRAQRMQQQGGGNGGN